MKPRLRFSVWVDIDTRENMRRIAVFSEQGDAIGFARTIWGRHEGVQVWSDQSAGVKGSKLLAISSHSRQPLEVVWRKGER